MTLILIGSRAAAVHGVLDRVPKDHDLVGDAAGLAALAARPEVASCAESTEHPGLWRVRLEDGAVVEVDATGNPSNALLEGLCDGATTLLGLPVRVASVAALWMTKRSHAPWDVHWEKTMHDLPLLKAATGREPTATERAYHDARRAEAVVRYGQRPRIASMPNGEFFARSHDGVGRVYVHDDLHRAVMYGDRPMFERIKRDLSLARCDRDLFEALGREDRLRAAREEIMVIALERFLVPGRVSVQGIAYRRAAKLVATTLTGGWFRDFVIDEWAELRRHDRDFVALFESALAAGRVRTVAEHGHCPAAPAA